MCPNREFGFFILPVVSENIEISEDCNTLNGLCYCYCLLELISSEDTGGMGTFQISDFQKRRSYLFSRYHRHHHHNLFIISIVIIVFVMMMMKMVVVIMMIMMMLRMMMVMMVMMMMVINRKWD